MKTTAKPSQARLNRISDAYCRIMIDIPPLNLAAIGYPEVLRLR